MALCIVYVFYKSISRLVCIIIIIMVDSCPTLTLFSPPYPVKRDVDGSPVKRDVAAGSSSHGMAGSGKGRGTPPPHPPPPVSTDDDDDELFQSTLSAHMADYSVFNRSWIRYICVCLCIRFVDLQTIDHVGVVQ